MWNENSVIPQEHQELVNERIENKADPSRLLDWETAKHLLNA